MCGIRLTREGYLEILLFCVYMPCDTEYDMSNLNEYNPILQVMIDLGILLDVNKIIVGGDFNTEFTRARYNDSDCVHGYADFHMCEILW